MCFFFQAEDGIRDDLVTGVQTCALPISYSAPCFKVSLNFKDIAAKQGAEYAEAQKKQDEEKQKFQGMKAHFDQGIGFLSQAGQAKADLAKAPADQRDTLKQQVKDLSDKAVTELEAAKAAAPE